MRLIRYPYIKSRVCVAERLVTNVRMRSRSFYGGSYPHDTRYPIWRDLSISGRDKCGVIDASAGHPVSYSALLFLDEVAGSISSDKDALSTRNPKYIVAYVSQETEGLRRKRDNESQDS